MNIKTNDNDQGSEITNNYKTFVEGLGTLYFINDGSQLTSIYLHII